MRRNVFLTLIAITVTLGSAASSVFNGRQALAQSKSKTTDASGAHADGKLSVDGKSTQLKYVYARRDSSASPLVDLIMTNQPISDDAITSILGATYRGSDKLRGFWLILDSKGRYQPPQLLLQSGEVPSTGGVMEMMSGDEFSKIENGRIRGKLECKISTPARTTAFVASYDAPLVVMPSDAAGPLSAEQFRKEFEKVMRGKWSIESWRNSNARSYSGILVVDERPSSGRFHGTFHLVYGKNKNKVDEDVTISRDGTKVRMEGHVAPGTSWSPDTFTFELRGDRLVGGARDDQGGEGNVVLRKAS
jgi:hypothetical protein